MNDVLEKILKNETHERAINTDNNYLNEITITFSFNFVYICNHL